MRNNVASLFWPRSSGRCSLGRVFMIAKDSLPRGVAKSSRSWERRAHTAPVTVRVNGKCGYCCAVGNSGDAAAERAGAGRGDARAGRGGAGGGGGGAGGGGGGPRPRPARAPGVGPPRDAGPAGVARLNWGGRRSPLHAAPDGKAVLAHLPEAALAECGTPPLARFPGRTSTGLARFPALLAGIRRQGYATAVEELEAGLTAVAAPARNAEGVVVASISASGPSFRIPADRIPVLAVSVRRAAAEVSRRLGWTAA